MANRTTFTGASTDVSWGNTPEVPEGLGDQYARFIKTLLDAAALPLTSVAGTGNIVAAALDPVLPPGGLLDGMKFTVTWAATNTGSVTLSINGGAAVPVLNAQGDALIAGAAPAGFRALLEYLGGSFRVLNTTSSDTLGIQKHYQVFTSSGVWIKPAGLLPNALVKVELWGAGGGGTDGVFPLRGGAGGGYMCGYFRAEDLPSSVSVGVGAGGITGTTGGNGGNTTFGALLTAYGGQSGGNGGAGGGEFGVADGGHRDINNGRAASPWGGGAGSSPVVSPSPAYVGGKSVFGGAGGGSPGVVHGTSIFGGNGGVNEFPGVAPGGGAGARSAGARGEARISC